MTIAELIVELQKLPQDMLVVSDCWNQYAVSFPVERILDHWLAIEDYPGHFVLSKNETDLQKHYSKKEIIKVLPL